jgi:nicotinamide mononucleotide transporter PnuC
MTLIDFFIKNFEIIAAVLGFFYVLLEVLQKSWMWYLWFFTSITYFFVYAQNDIYAMMLLQVYNAVICVYGIIQWKRTKNLVKETRNKVKNSNGYSIDTGEVSNYDKDDLIVKKLHPKMAIISLMISVIVFIAMAIILDKFTNDASPWLDSGVTTLCMLATFYLSRQNIENWYVWIVCNLISVYFYYSLKMYPTTLLYVVYVVMATWGYFHWRKKGVKVD